MGGDDGAAPDGSPSDGTPPCAEAGCDRPAEVYLFDRDADRWRPACRPHATHAHPSIELKAWMESGYLKPVELGRPEEPPGDPVTDRQAAFREEVDETMGWTDE